MPLYVRSLPRDERKSCDGSRSGSGPRRFARRELARPGGKGHARLTVSDILWRALCAKPGGGERLDHGVLAVARKPDALAQTPIVRQPRAEKADESGDQKSIRRAETQKRCGIGSVRELRRDHVAHDQEP